MPNWKIILGDCIEEMKKLEENSIDSICTDSPYALINASRNGSLRSNNPDNPAGRHGSKGGMMGLEWDAPGDGTLKGFQEWTETWAREAIRVLKPGGHMVVFGAPRTSHRMACGIEDAGWEIRDSISWIFGSGFSKGQNIGKTIDKIKRGHPHGTEDPESPNHGKYKGGGGQGAGASTFLQPGQTYQSGEEKKGGYYNYNSTLKPAHEIIVLARKPLETNSIATNVLKWGTGAINIGATRVSLEGENLEIKGDGAKLDTVEIGLGFKRVDRDGDLGRYPPNFLLSHSIDCEMIGYKSVKSNGHHSGRVPDGGGLYNLGLKPQEDLGNIHAEDGLEKIEDWECSESCPIRLLDEQTGLRKSGGNISGDEPSKPAKNVYGDYKRTSFKSHADIGTASRFFPKFSIEDYDLFYYCPKASRSEREAGCEVLKGGETYREGPMAGRGAPGLKCKNCNKWKNSGNPCKCSATDFEQVQFERKEIFNDHISVKPLKLMRWLVKLVTPDFKESTILDPFGGSGSTLCAAVLEGFNCIGIEQDPHYVDIAKVRIQYWESTLPKTKQKTLEGI